MSSSSKLENPKEVYWKWFEGSFVELCSLLEQHDLDAKCFSSLLTKIELSAYIHFSNEPKRSLIETIKWGFIWLFDNYTYSLDKDKTGTKYDVIFWPTQNKHLTLQAPVYQALKSTKAKSIFISNTQEVKKSLEEQQLPSISITAHKKSLPNFNKIAFIFKCLKLAKKIKPFKIKGQSIQFSDIVFDAFKVINVHYGTKQILDILVEKTQPQIIMVGYDLSIPARTIIENAENYGFKTGVIQMGRLNYDLIQHTKVDYHFCYGQKTKEYLQKNNQWGVEPVVTGSIKLELFGDKEVQAINEMVDSTRKKYPTTVLVTFSGPGHSVTKEGHINNIKCITAVAEALNKEVFFIFKLHSKDNPAYFSSLQKLENTLIIDQQHHLYKYDVLYLIAKCDFVITGASTTALEAIAMEKPVISLDMQKEFYNIPFLSEQVYKYTSNQAELIDFIKLLVKEKSNEAYISMIKSYSNDFFCRNGVPPSQKIAAYLNQQVLNSSNKLQIHGIEQ